MAADRDKLATSVASYRATLVGQEKEMEQLRVALSTTEDAKAIVKAAVESERAQRLTTAQLLVEAHASLEAFPAQVAALEKEKAQRDRRIVRPCPSPHVTPPTAP